MPIRMIEYIEKNKKIKYVVVLVDGYVRCVTDDLSIRQDAVDSHTCLRGPGHCWHQRKRGGSLCPSGHHLTFRANLKGQQYKGSIRSLDLTTNIFEK